MAATFGQGANSSQYYSCATSLPSSGWTRSATTTYDISSGYVGTTNPLTWGAHLISLPSSVLVASATGTASQTNYSYDGESSVCPQGGALTSVAVTTGHDETNFSTAYLTRGNATCVARNTGAQWVTTGKDYDTAGNVLHSYDGMGHQSTYAYTDATGYGLLSSAADPMGHAAGYTYVQDVAKPYIVTAPNGATTTYNYGDPLDRLTNANQNGIRQTSFAYNNAAPPVTDTYASAQTFTDNGHHGQILYDGLGREIAQIAYNGSQVAARVDTQYDGFGRVWQVSNPVASSSQGTDWTVTTYDSLGRVVAVTHPDSSQAITSYDVSAATANPTGQAALTTTIADESGKQRVQYVDGLGRLIGVVEDPGSGHANYSSIYAYDGLDNLRTVTQGGQTRTFTYDMLGRLLTATNPESGTISYAYDNNGNVIRKVDARNVATCFWLPSSGACGSSGTTYPTGYDGLNRPIAKQYSDGTPPVQFCYDGQTYAAGGCTGGPATAEAGFLTGVGNATSSSAYLHQALGLVRWSSQTTNNAPPYDFDDPNNPGAGYAYNADGSLKQVVYPSGRAINYGYDGAGRPTSVTGSGSATYAAGITYAPHGALAQLTLGNTLVERWQYNTRLQPTDVILGTNAGDASKLHLTLDYGPATSNNGNVASESIAWGGATQFAQQFTYGDNLNRLTGFQEGTVADGYSYDRYGNRAISTNRVESGLYVLSLTNYDTATNRLLPSTGFGYDAAGGLISEPPALGVSLQYDAEGRLVGENNGLATYAYDGEGRRVMKTVGTQTTVYVYDAAGNLAAEYGSTAAAGTQYLTADHLGSTRLVTGAGGAVLERHDYTPFGEDLCTENGRNAIAEYTAGCANTAPPSGVHRQGTRCRIWARLL